MSTCVLQVRTLLAGQTTAQKVSALGDALDSVDERDTPAVLKELVEHLTPVNRQLTLLPLLTDLVSEERTAVLSPLLADLGRDELMASLSARAQREKMLSSMPPAMLSGILSELPHTVDGARLANMLPPEALQLWGSNLLAAAPESTCKAWLTQLLVQLKAKSTYSSLSQLLVSALGPEYFAYSYANLCMDDRLHMLRCIDEIKQLKVVSPAPWSKQENRLLAELLGLRSGTDSLSSSVSASPFGSPQLATFLERRRRGSVVGAVPVAAPPPRVRDKVQLLPLDQISRTIAEIYQKKVKDDQLSDSKGKLRCPMVRFVRNYLLRQYGMKSMAEKALRELTATVRAYSNGGASSLVRVRMFGEVAGMLKDRQGVVRPPWSNRKTDFFLFVVSRLARCAKDEHSEPSKRPAADDDRMRMSALQRARRQGVGSQRALPMTSASIVASIKEVLCREEVFISLNTVNSVLEMAVPDATVCTSLINRLHALSLEQAEEDEDAPTGGLHMDDVLEVSMLMWEEQEATLEPKVNQMVKVSTAHSLDLSPHTTISGRSSH